MKLRNRFTAISSLTFGIVFIIASVIIYLSFYNYSQRMIFRELHNTCLLAGIYYLEKDELPQKQHFEVRQQFAELQEAVIWIYDADNTVAFGDKDADRNINPKRLDIIRKKNTLSFKSENHFYFGLFYHDNQGDFVVFVKTNDRDFKEQTHQLLIILAAVLLAGLVLIYILSRLLSNFAYRPVNDVIRQVSHIEAHSLDTPVSLPPAKDELYELIETFNNLLKRLSDTFIIQKNFINYVSHEFKTPLAAISGNLEVFAQKERSPAEYKIMAEKVLENVYEIEGIMNTLMMLSGLRTSADTFQTYRVDELIWDINDQIAETHTGDLPQIKITITVEDENIFTLKGNNAEIKIALYNIIENAVKYSDSDPVAIRISEKAGRPVITIQDNGRGIHEDDMKFIKQTFYRGSNVSDVKGSGIGLSLAIIIFRQNNIGFDIASTHDVGTTVTLTF